MAVACAIRVTDFNAPVMRAVCYLLAGSQVVVAVMVLPMVNDAGVFRCGMGGEEQLKRLGVFDAQAIRAVLLILAGAEEKRQEAEEG